MTNLSNILSICWFWYVCIYTHVLNLVFCFLYMISTKRSGSKRKEPWGEGCCTRQRFDVGWWVQDDILPFTLGFFTKSPITIFLKESRRMEYHKDTWMSQEMIIDVPFSPFSDGPSYKWLPKRARVLGSKISQLLCFRSKQHSFQ